MKWESDGDLKGARDGVVSENALLGAFTGFQIAHVSIRSCICIVSKRPE